MTRTLLPLVILLVAVASLPWPFAAADEDAPTDAAVTTWIDTLVEKLADENDRVRKSAGAALLALGDDARPRLESLAQGTGEVAEIAKRLLARGQRGPRRGPRDGDAEAPRPPMPPEPPRGRGPHGFGQPEGGPDGRRGPRGRGGDPLDGMDLTEEQRGQIDEIQKACHEKHKAIDDETKAALGEILSEEQVEALMGRRHRRGGPDRGPGGPGPGGGGPGGGGPRGPR